MTLNEVVEAAYPEFREWVKKEHGFLYCPPLPDIQLWEEFEAIKKQRYHDSLTETPDPLENISEAPDD